MQKTSKILINPTTKMPENERKFHCVTCNFVCYNKYNYNIHTSTSKHKTLTNPNEKNVKKSIECSNCGKIYKHSSTLCAHKKTCIKIINDPQINNIELKIIDDNIDNNDTIYDVIYDKKNENNVCDSSSNQIKLLSDIVIEIYKSNNALQTRMMDLQQQNHDIQKQMLEVCKNIQPSNINATINTDNSNNSKTFNLNVFLNEKCKNAMNLDDFANSIQLKLSDLIRVGEEGYVPGMSKVFIEWLGDIKECDRPIHCSDEKREAIQVKMADKWEKEAIDSVNLMNAVRIVEQKQFDMLTTFRETYPECMNSESHHNDMLIKLFQNLSNSKQPEFIKVIKKVAKAVIINKEKHA
jgi:hypothetical protein